MVSAWQPVEVDSQGGCILRFLLGKQFKSTYKEAVCCGFCMATSSD